MGRINVNIDDENIKFLYQLKKKSKISINKIINYMIREVLNGNKKFSLIDNDDNSELEKEIRIKLTSKEKEKLDEFSNFIGFNNSTSGARFVILNSLHKEKFFTKAEVNEFIMMRYEINAIGKNIFQLLKNLRERNFVIIKDKDIETMINDTRESIEVLSEKLEKLIDRNNERI
ncbi:TPA: hypothetical protein SG634_001184 [Campylobacter coli]|nr:hypothetical protein [Campylobacter coli]HEH4956939.1 hypothetical protein [Campylobacter coli]